MLMRQQGVFFEYQIRLTHFRNMRFVMPKNSTVLEDKAPMIHPEWKQDGTEKKTTN